MNKYFKTFIICLIFIISLSFTDQVYATETITRQELVNLAKNKIGHYLNNANESCSPFYRLPETSDPERYQSVFAVRTHENDHKYHFISFSNVNCTVNDWIYVYNYCQTRPTCRYLYSNYLIDAKGKLYCYSSGKWLTLDSHGTLSTVIYDSNYSSYDFYTASSFTFNPDDEYILIWSNIDFMNNNFNDSEFDESLGSLDVNISRYLNQDVNHFSEIFTINEKTSTGINVKEAPYGVMGKIIFENADKIYETDFKKVNSLHFTHNWKNQSCDISCWNYPSDFDITSLENYSIVLTPYSLVNGVYKHGYCVTYNFSDYDSNSNDHYIAGGSGGHRIVLPSDAEHPEDLEIIDNIQPLPFHTGTGLTIQPTDKVSNKYIHQYNYPSYDNRVQNFINNNTTNNYNSIVDIPDDINDSDDWDFSILKSFIQGIYKFLRKLSNILVIYFGFPDYVAKFINISVFVILFLIFGGIIKKIL